MRRLETTYSSLCWSDDGALVTKTRPATLDARERFRNERRVSRLVTTCPPPVRTPRLVAYDAPRRSLTFEALPGEPLGPKYPVALADAQIEALVAIGHELARYNPRRRWLRRFDSARRIGRAERAGLVDPAQAGRLLAVARRAHTKLRFAHGDVTARNALDCADGVALIDWEWAGCYPPGYDHAFLWYSLVDVPGGRDQVEARVTVAEESFLLSALLVVCRHLELYVPAEFAAKHLASRDDLLVRLGCQ